MTDDQNHVLIGHAVGDRDRLLGVAGIVAGQKFKLLAENAALGVDILHCHVRAAGHLLAEGGVLAGDRPDHADRDVRGGGNRYGGCQKAGGEECRSQRCHGGSAPWARRCNEFYHCLRLPSGLIARAAGTPGKPAGAFIEPRILRDHMPRLRPPIGAASGQQQQRGGQRIAGRR